MADITYLPAEPAAPELPGGRTRPSVLADLSALPMVARRRELNERLLDGTCGVGAREGYARFGPEDLELLLLVTRERFGPGSALLRNQAVVALGSFDTPEAAQRLSELALSPVEVDGIRLAALGALGADRAREMLDELTGDQSSVVRDYARMAAGELAVPERGKPRPVPQDHQGGPQRSREGDCR